MMKMKFSRIAFVCLSLPLSLLSACIVRGRTAVSAQTTVATPDFNPAVSATVAVPSTDVQVVQAQCQPGAQELCNGLDDNCNGVIDEGCGYQGGNIQITAAWQTASDIDLHVIDPLGAEIYYAQRASASGGRLDHDANAACSNSPPIVENVYWDTPSPPSGTYRVRLVAYDMCGVPVTPTTVSISVGGRIIGTYRADLMQRGQQVEIPFTVP